MNAKAKRYSIRYSVCLWVISILIYVAVVAVVWYSWPTVMAGGEPGVTSDMLLLDRQAISQDYRTRITLGYIILGVLVAVLYWGLWFCNSLPASEKELAVFVKKYRYWYCSTALSCLMMYSQACFTIPAIEAVWNSTCISWFSIFVLTSQLILAIYHGKKGFRKRRRHSNKKHILTLIILVLEDSVLLGAIISVFEELSKVFKGINIFWNLIAQHCVFPAPYVVRNGYDLAVAWGVPLLLLALLHVNAKYNAHYRIGVPLNMIPTDSGMYTLVKMKDEEEWI